MVVYTLEQRWEILRQINLQKIPILAKKKKCSFQMELILKIMVMLQNMCENCRMFVTLWKKWKKLASSSINQSVKNQKKVHTLENIAAVADSMCEAPSTSIHRSSQQLHISQISLRRTLRKDLGMKPYKVRLVQKLKPMRFRFAKWPCDRPTVDADFGSWFKYVIWWWQWSVLMTSAGFGRC